jgi:phage tail-like protein
MAIKFSRDTLKGLTKNSGDFHLSHKFGLEIDGVTVGGVHKIDGIEFEAEVVEYNDGEDMMTHCRPGVLRPGKITVERDFSNTKEFYQWRSAVINGKTDRRSLSVIFQNDKGDEAKRINFFQCFPAKWVGPALNSKSSGHATEKLEIIFEEYTIA